MSDDFPTPPTSPPTPPPTAPPSGGEPPAPSYGGPPAGHGGEGLAWEASKDPMSLVATAKRFILSPGAAFAAAKEKGDYLSPLLFAVILGLLGALLGSIWTLLLGGPGALFEGLEGIPPELAEALAGPTGITDLMIGLVLAPIFTAIFLFIWSGLVHLTLSLLGGLKDSTAGFEGTFRSSSYASVAYLAQVVPMFGGFISFVWSVALQVIGLAKLHRTSQGKALAAVLIPLAICCCLVVGGVLAFGAVIAAALGAAAN